MRYEPIPLREKREILISLFDKKLAFDQRNLLLLSSIYNFEAAFFVELFMKIMAGDDVQLKLAAIRATPEAIQSTGYTVGVKAFIVELKRFKREHKFYAEEIEKILNEVKELRTIFTDMD